MALLRLGCINARGLWSEWKQGHLLNDLRSLRLDVVAISETRISETSSHALLLNDYEVYASFGRHGGAVSERPGPRAKYGLS